MGDSKDRTARRRNSVSIAGRIWRTNLAAALLIAALAAAASLPSAPQAPNPGRLPPSSLPSIEPEQKMLSAIDGYAADNLERSEAEAQFSQQLGVEQRSVTDPAQVALVSQIASSGVQFFGAARKSGREALGKGLRSSLQQLSATKRSAARHAGRRFVLPNAGALAAPGLAALAILFLLGAAFSINRNSVRRPIDELIEGLKRIDHESATTLTPPGTAEFGMLAKELNAMFQRLGNARRERADELLSERAIAAAILRNLEDGVIVLDENGALIHINELARVILNLDPNGLIGSDFNDLAAENRQVRQLLEAGQPGHEDGIAPEFKCAYRGRDRFYAARRALWSTASGAAAAIFVLKDVTLSHDQEPTAAAAVGATIAALGRANSIAVAAPTPPPLLVDRSATVDAAARSNQPGATVSGRKEQPQATSGPKSSILQPPIEPAKSSKPAKPPESPAAVEAAGPLQSVQIEPAQEPAPAPQPSPEAFHPSRKDAPDSAFSNGFAEKGSNETLLMLDATVREVCAPLKVQADEMGVEFVVIADQPLAVLGDPIELPRAITRLVSEALCHTPADGRVTVVLERDHSRNLARFVVTGTGISSAGFSEIKQVIESHRGRMVARLDALAGVSYILELPVRTEREHSHNAVGVS